MIWLIDKTLTLLASDAGNLTYHLVLAFSIAGALQIALNQYLRHRTAENRRMLYGIGLLLLFQIVLFTCSGLVWQGVLDGRILLPLLDRSAGLISLVVIGWLWCFPRPEPGADAASLLVGFLAFVGCTFGSLWWIRMINEGALDIASLNGSLIDFYFQIASLAAIGLGVLLLSLTRPSAWGYGLTMFALLAAGHAAALLLPFVGDFPTVLRLFEMAAFPFLLALPQRQIFIESSEPETETEENGSQPDVAKTSNSPLTSDPAILKSLVSLLDDTSEDQACNRIAAILATIARADQSFLVSPPDEQGQIRIICGYDKGNRRYVSSASIEGSLFPILTSCLRMGRVRRLAAASSSPDRLNLTKMYGLEQTGAMLFVPVLAGDGEPLTGAILVSADPQNDWSVEEQSMIGLLAKFLIQFLRRAQERATMRTELGQSRQAVRRIQDRAQQVFEDEQKLRDQIAALQESAQRDQGQILQMSALIAEQTMLEKTIAGVQEEKHKLEEAARQMEEEAAQRKEPLVGELRLALQEIALLRLAIAEAEERLASQEYSLPQAGLSSSQSNEIISITQDLRQPLASMVGYTDVLLGESIGILGANQRKYLERIKLSTERFSRMLDEIVQVSMIESDPSRLEMEELDVREIIEEAGHELNGLIHLKQIAFKKKLPELALKITSDRDGLQKAVIQLLRNACAATPEGGEVSVAARLESSESERDFVLIQVADQGKGISTQDLPRIFTPAKLRASENPPAQIQGLGNTGVDFVRIKTLIEALGGRTWVDSEPGTGAVFSILLPATHEGIDEPEAEELA
jgi:signal transduction histidine kinase